MAYKPGWSPARKKRKKKLKPKEPLGNLPALWVEVPRVDWDAPEAEQLAQLVTTLDRAHHNLQLAHETFNTAWKQWTYARQQAEPHDFVVPRPGSGIPSVAAQAHMPLSCSLCFRLRADVRHGPLKVHPFEPCGLSVQIGGYGKPRCFQCGLTEGMSAHDAAKGTIRDE